LDYYHPAFKKTGEIQTKIAVLVKILLSDISNSAAKVAMSRLLYVQQRQGVKGGSAALFKRSRKAVMFAKGYQPAVCAAF
jgi:hypothetical protein